MCRTLRRVRMGNRRVFSPVSTACRFGAFISPLSKDRIYSRLSHSIMLFFIKNFQLLHFHMSHNALLRSLSLLLSNTPSARAYVAAGKYTALHVYQNFWIWVHAWDWYGKQRAVHPSMSMREQRTRTTRGWWLAWTRRNLPSARVCVAGGLVDGTPKVIQGGEVDMIAVA